MVSNVISLVALLGTVSYSQCFSHGHSQSHNHAYSSQSITMHQNHQEPVYYHHPDPYNDEFEQNPENQVEEDDHLINQNHHIPDHRQFYKGQILDDYQNHQLNHKNHHLPDHRNLFKGQPIVVASGYKGMPPKDHQDHQQMFFKHQHIPFHIAQDMPIMPHYNMPSNPFEHHEMPVNHHHKTPIRIDSHKHRHHNVNHIPRREYEFNYNIEDKLTGDHKAHHETRNDGVVKGVYSFQEADGSIRIVEYTADAKNGFHAKVRHEGQKHKIPKHHKNYSHRPRYHPQHNNLHPLLFNSPKY